MESTTAWMLVFAGAQVALVAPFVLQLQPLRDAPALAWAGLAYLVLLSSVGSYLLWSFALSRAEASAVASAEGIRLAGDDMGAYAQEICQRTANNVNSMLQDVHRQRRTEVEAINGAVVREGTAAGVQTPINQVLTALIRGVVDTYAARVAH